MHEKVELHDKAELHERSEPIRLITSTQAKAAARHRSVLNRLSTGTGAFNIIGHRRKYYAFSACLVLGAALSMVIRGFNWGMDFIGGTQLTFTPPRGLSTAEVSSVVTQAYGSAPDAVQTVGSNVAVSMPTLDASAVSSLKAALTSAFQLTGGVSDSAVSETWGGEISSRALVAVLVFLVAVAAFIWLRYEKRVAFGAVVSVIHDLIVTAGIYALIGFEIAPATVIGLLTILGFSLYDTVVVYDKVQENTKGLTSLLRRTYPEAANLAINQTLMRSINTSLIALLPVAGLLVAGVRLGGGTLEDLALVMLVGMLVGAYSSVFLAVPMAVDLKLRDPQIKSHTARVVAKRKNDGIIVDSDGDPIGRTGDRAAVVPGAVLTSDAPGGADSAAGGASMVPAARVLTPGAAPRPGAKPQRPSGKSARPTGKRGR